VFYLFLNNKKKILIYVSSKGRLERYRFRTEAQPVAQNYPQHDSSATRAGAAQGKNLTLNFAIF
jgi:hypothetical protein